MTISYLVATAGHAQEQNERYPHEVRSILQLISDGADELGNEKVVGFTEKEDDHWICRRYSYLELLSLSSAQAASLAHAGLPAVDKGIVSLLCPTGLDFLVTWISLMRMGYAVVFVAPQCSPSAIAHLHSSSSSTRLIYHPKYASLGESAQQVEPSIQAIPLPSRGTHASDIPHPRIHDDTLSHIFHTSGTSGTPKPIPHTHLVSVQSLPRRMLPSYLRPPSHVGFEPESAAFTTTPLFHGGVSDLLRAWMARCMIYFYPTSDQPVTAQNLVDAVNVCQEDVGPLDGIRLDSDGASARRDRFKVTSFLSVPYILTILSERPAGVAMLKAMDLVSTGGAPLDTAIGEGMVQKGIKLVSRMGSSECGFLLSSYRSFEREKDWEWLRNDSKYASALVFEPVPGSDDRFEMVVTSAWRSKSKSNRPDGSYATGDLYLRHPIKRDVWKYMGKGDDVIVMNNGEKVSPGPIETALRSSGLFSDVLVVGENRPQLGVLLFPKRPSDASLSPDGFSQLLELANKDSPSFAHISPECSRVIDLNAIGKQIPKSSKGTIQRGLANEVFKDEIEALFSAPSNQGGLQPTRSVEELEEYLEREILGVLGSKRRGASTIHHDADLFAFGVDSLMTARLWTSMTRDLHTGGKPLPRNVVFEKPSIARLARYLYDLQEDQDTPSNEADSHQLMRDLVEKYGDFNELLIDPTPKPAQPRQCRTIVLTGCTGSLGSFLLAQTANSLPEGSRIVCLVRATDDLDAKRRVQDALAARRLAVDLEKYEAYSSDFAKQDLGLGREVYASISSSLNYIIHAAWPVHFSSTLISFEESIKGLRHLLDVTRSSSQGRIYFCSSVASITSQPGPGPLLEEPSNNPSTASPIGYSQSKWVAEQLCFRARARDDMRRRVTVLRVGQLCGDRVTGKWNEKEGWPLLIKSGQVTGCLPDLAEDITWLPVDTASSAIIDIVHSNDSNGIHHIVQPRPTSWRRVLNAVKACGMVFERVPPAEWVKRVESSEDDLEKNPSKGMLGIWQSVYGSGTPPVPPKLDCSKAMAASRSMGESSAVGEEDVTRMVKAWQASGFLHS